MKSTTKAWLRATEKVFRSEIRDQRVFTGEQLRLILQQHRVEFGIPTSMGVQAFASALHESDVLRRVEVLPEQNRKKNSLESYKPFVRYVSPDITAAQLAISLRPGSYFSHGTAAYLHGLTTKRLDAIYVNKEQSPKPGYATELTQGTIDVAFRNPARVSNYVYLFGAERMVLLSGKNTSDYEVVGALDEGGFPIRFTSLERTLVDMAVRPVYAGGVVAVLSAYRAASHRISMRKLVDVVKKLEHTYPYHQAVGYYLQQAGQAAEELMVLKRLGLKFNFYLGNQSKGVALDAEWRVYVPQEVAATRASPSAPATRK